MDNENQNQQQTPQPAPKGMSDEILGAITSGELKMRSRFYFILRDTLGIVAIVIVLLMAVYIASFIIFVLHQNGAWFVPVFGLAGWFALFSALPWMLILLSAIFIILLAVLVKRYYRSAHQWPIIYSVLGIVFLIAAACFLFIQTSFYNQFFGSSIAQDVPFLGLYYPGFGRLESNDIHRGTIMAATGNDFTLEDTGGETSNVVITSSTNIAFGTVFHAGDTVVVFGTQNASDTIYAFGLEKLGN